MGKIDKNESNAIHFVCTEYNIDGVILYIFDFILKCSRKIFSVHVLPLIVTHTYLFAGASNRWLVRTIARFQSFNRSIEQFYFDFK